MLKSILLKHEVFLTMKLFGKMNARNSEMKKKTQVWLASHQNLNKLCIH